MNREPTTTRLRPRGSRLRAAALLAALCPSAAPALAQWAEREVTDPRSGDRAAAPGGRNDRGFQLDLLRGEAGEVVAIFRLPPGNPDFLDAARPPVLRVDDGPPQAALLREAGLTWVAFPVWNGQGAAATGTLRELMEGATLEVTYFLYGGGYKSTTLPLAGAAPVLAAAFGVPERITAEQRAAARELEAALEQEGARCLELKGRKRERCLEVARVCIGSSATAADLRACIERAGG